MRVDTSAAAGPTSLRVGYVPALMLLRGLSCKRQGRVWRSRSGARVVGGDPRYGAPSGDDRIPIIGFATLGRERGQVFSGDPREVAALFDVSWSLRTARERLARVAHHVLYRPAWAMDCSCECPELGAPVRVADDYRYCPSSRRFHIRLSDSFMREVADGAPVSLDTVGQLKPYPTALDLYFLYALRANRGDRRSVPLFGDSGVCGMMEIARATRKARSEIVKRERILAECWPNKPYRYEREHDVIVCVTEDPSAALMAHVGGEVAPASATPSSGAEASAVNLVERVERPDPTARGPASRGRAMPATTSDVSAPTLLRSGSVTSSATRERVPVQLPSEVASQVRGKVPLATSGAPLPGACCPDGLAWLARLASRPDELAALSRVLTLMGSSESSGKTSEPTTVAGPESATEPPGATKTASTTTAPPEERSGARRTTAQLQATNATTSEPARSPKTASAELRPSVADTVEALVAHPDTLAAAARATLPPESGLVTAQAFRAMEQQLAPLLAAMSSGTAPLASNHPPAPANDGIKRNIRFLVPRHDNGEPDGAQRPRTTKRRRKRRGRKQAKRGPPDKPP